MAEGGPGAAALSADHRLGPARLDQARLEAWGEAIGRGAAAGRIALPLVLALRGELGAGKSVLARAVARGAGVTSAMPSPTFNLVFSYAAPGDITVNHVDLYRLDDPEEIWELGWQELGVGRQLVLIEWPERAGLHLPGDRWEVGLRKAEAEAGAEAKVGERGYLRERADSGERWVLAERVGGVGDIPDPGDFAARRATWTS